MNITGIKARKLIDKGAIVIDVRDPVSFRDGTVPGATNLSLRQLSHLQKHPKTTPIIIFGASATDPTLLSAINYLTLYGFSQVFSMGTLDNWIN